MAKCILHVIVLLGYLSFGEALAQGDTAFYSSYQEMLTGRFYFSKKYTTVSYFDPQEHIRLRYVPNTTLNMGVGATYKAATLNLAYGFGFLNPERGRGETKYLDLQGHLYGQKLLIDFFGQFYKGFYLRNNDLRDAAGNYYIRPDLRVREIGLTAQFIPNSSRFSYRAGFLQNEWQKRSAGSLLLGWQFLFGSALSDSTIVPYSLRTQPSEVGENQLSFIETGPSVGYAYTLVIRKHFFIMASAAITLDIGFNKVETPDRVTSTSVIPNFGIKAFAGYNNEINAISLTFANETVNLKTGSNDLLFSISTGNLRMNFVHRFNFDKKFFRGRN